MEDECSLNRQEDISCTGIRHSSDPQNLHNMSVTPQCSRRTGRITVFSWLLVKTMATSRFIEQPCLKGMRWRVTQKQPHYHPPASLWVSALGTHIHTHADTHHIQTLHISHKDIYKLFPHTPKKMQLSSVTLKFIYHVNSHFYGLFWFHSHFLQPFDIQPDNFLTSASWTLGWILHVFSTTQIQVHECQTKTR